MKILRLTIFLLLIYNLSVGQTFKRYKQTKYYSATLKDKKDPNKIIYDYIKRGDTVLVLGKNLLQDFLIVFENNPTAFDSLFANLPTSTNKLEVSLGKTKYNLNSFIQSVNPNTGPGIENIWNIQANEQHPCYLEIYFKNKTNGSKKTEDLQFIKVVKGECEF